jgi:hypothetical protein
MNRSPSQQRTRVRRLIASFLVAAYLIPDLLPGLIAFAAPQVFSHPGAGVQGASLGTGGLSASAFGDLSDAVNLANGNVYLGIGGMSFNSNNASANGVGGSGWNLSQRLTDFLQ